MQLGWTFLDIGQYGGRLLTFGGGERSFSLVLGDSGPGAVGVQHAVNGGESDRVSALLHFVDGAPFQRHGDGIGHVDARVVKVSVDEDGDRHYHGIAFRRPLDQRYGAGRLLLAAQLRAGDAAEHDQAQDDGNGAPQRAV